MSFIMGYMLGAASQSHENCPDQVPELNIEIEKCKVLPTKAQTLVCLKDIEKQQHDANVFAGYLTGGFMIGVALIIALVFWKA